MNDAIRAQPAKLPLMLITRNLPPLRGGMERLNQHVAMELASWFEVHVVGPEGCTQHLPSVVEVREVPVRPLWRFLLRTMHRSLQWSRKVRPRVVIAGSGLAAPFAVVVAKVVGARSVVYAHGLDLVVQHPVYRLLWRPFLRRCDLCIVNSRNTARLARDIGISAETVVIIHPGVTLPETLCSEDDKKAFCRRHDLSLGNVLLSVGRITPRKGLREFVCESLPSIVAAHPDTVLLVIGDEAPDALNGTAAGSAVTILEHARQRGLEQNVRVLGVCSDTELDVAYDVADVCIFPLRETPGDVEGFGMVAVEAAAHGLPTVAFDVGGVGDAISEGNSGWLVKSGDYPAFASRVVGLLQGGTPAEMRANCRQFAEGFAWPHFGMKLQTELHQLIDTAPPARATPAS